MAANWFFPVSRRKRNKNRNKIVIKKTREKNWQIQLSQIGCLLNEQDLLRYKETI